MAPESLPDNVLEQLGFLAPDWKDLLEILVVAAVFYWILILLAGTRAMQMLLGLLLLFGVYVISRILGFDLLRGLLEYVFQFGAIAALVVFQPEMRNALAQLGQNRIWRRFFNRFEESRVAEEIAQAAVDLARTRTGALIAIEREVGLGEFAETGTVIQARVSAPLLATIFTPYSPLHDGAVIVRGETIVAASAILPLTRFPVEDKGLGTRHRAAIGLSEETDALVVVVSEETSQISLASRGRLRRGLNRESLAAAIAMTGKDQKPVAR
ncbi:MAG: diadenylate cyclase CdaA [Gemmatimonadota bacterium]|nr:diadenylate cyclase CdaA [Gemmatimonadota bacterium]